MLLLLFACHSLTPTSGAPPPTTPGEPVLRRLTTAQYERSIVQLFGDDLVFSQSLEPDAESDGLLAVGAGVNALSAWGVEQYEASALSLVEQALDPARRDRFIPCTPSGTVDSACAEATLEPWLLRAWRRPATAEELSLLVGLADQGGEALGDFYGGLGYALVAALQAPAFIYRIELGEVDPERPGKRRFTSYEMASRLAFLLWDSPPDDALLAAAASGALLTDEGLLAETERLWADERASLGVRAFFSDMLGLYELDALSKDPTIFVHMSPELGPSAREETLLGLEYLVRTVDGDYRDLFTTQTTFLDQKLAAIYRVPAPVPDGFGQVELPESARRRGLLGQVSVLALHAHATSSSPTLRGKFVRETLLCQSVPPPPVGVNTSLPESDVDAPTRREQVAQHLLDPACASCHKVTDPIGLGLENYDGLGGWRDTENDVVIDASGELDGVPFADAYALGAVLHDHPELPPCLVDTVLRYSNGRSLTDAELPLRDRLTKDFANAGYSVKSLLFMVIQSDAFRQAGEVSE